MTLSLIAFAVLLLLIFMHVPIAFAMAVVGVVGFALVRGVEPALFLVGSIARDTVLTSDLSVVPLFILMGNFVARSKLAEELYEAAHAFVGHFKGGLAMATIIACGAFSSVCGSSLATAATMVNVSLPPMRKKGYATSLAAASIAAGGTLGNLIPPGIAFIIYGVLTNTSVARLYAGGVFPGLALTLMFMGIIVLLALWRPSIAPREVNSDPMLVRLKRLVDLLPPLIIFVVVMGSIYSGWATSTEAAALAVIVTLPIAAFYGKLTIDMLHDAFLSTVNLTALSMLILAGAFAMNFVLGLLGVTSALTKFVASMNVTPLELIYVLFAFYVILGTFFETLPMMVGTLPLVHPLIVAAGIDPVWFGVFLVLMCEISLISPPVGMTLYVIQAVRNEGSIGDVFRGTVPFFVTMLLMTVLLIHWQDLALWLPRVAFD